MKQFLSLACLCFLAVAGFAQTAPTLTPEQKLTIRDAQHKLDGIEKQQKDLTAQIQQLQTQIQTESQRLTKSYQDAKTALDKAESDAAAGVDDKKWKPDWEALTFTAVPAAAPNASAPKPAPPAQQAKK